MPQCFIVGVCLSSNVLCAFHESFEKWTMCALWLCIFSRICLWPILPYVLAQWKAYFFISISKFSKMMMYTMVGFFIVGCLGAYTHVNSKLSPSFLLSNNDPLLSSFESLYPWALGHSCRILWIFERNNKLVWRYGYAHVQHSSVS